MLIGPVGGPSTLACKTGFYYFGFHLAADPTTSSKETTRSTVPPNFEVNADLTAVAARPIRSSFSSITVV
jgi:hypothetical protein